MRNMIRYTVIAVLALACTMSLSAATILNQSSAAYYANFGTGGTGMVLNACVGLGCPAVAPPSVPIGDTSGTELFDVTSLVVFDGTNTIYSYALQNVNIPGEITGFALLGPGFTGTETSPANWSAIIQPSLWAWLCSPEAAGSAACGTPAGQAFPGLGGFTVTLPGAVLPIFRPIQIQVGVNTDFVGPLTLDWSAAGPGQQVTTPEPASLALLISGLLGAGLLIRRRR